MKADKTSLLHLVQLVIFLCFDCIENPFYSKFVNSQQNTYIHTFNYTFLLSKKPQIPLHAGNAKNTNYKIEFLSLVLTLSAQYFFLLKCLVIMKIKLTHRYTVMANLLGTPGSFTIYFH